MRTSPSSVSGKLIAHRTSRSSPIAPSSTSSTSRFVCGWWRHMKPSISKRPARSAASKASSTRSAPTVERLLAEHVLARLERADRPLDVERVRQPDVDGLDLRIREQRLVAAVGAVDPALARVRVGTVLVAARDCRDAHPIREAAPARTALLMRAVESRPQTTGSSRESVS